MPQLRPHDGSTRAGATSRSLSSRATHSRWTAAVGLVALTAAVGLPLTQSASAGAPKTSKASTASTVTGKSVRALGAAPAPAGGWTDGSYVVTLLDAPLASYTGGKSGLARTAAAGTAKFNSAAALASPYRAYLDRQLASVAASVGVKSFYTYRTALTGFAAKLTAAQAARLASDPRVMAVSKDTLRKVDISNTPTFLGLTGPKGAWARTGGAPTAGKGVVVGVIDTGLWPENPSVAALPGNPAPPTTWSGECVTGVQWTAANCSSKVIGARWFVDGFGAGNLLPSEFLSARDGDSHGTHTSTTAAGDLNKSVVINGFNFGVVSGMAPAAQIAVYKVCWNGEAGGCATSDSVAAIDAAINDGVNVLNFSISGSLSSSLDPVEVGFLNAAAAGVFVAASAGNSGPTASTVAHNSPWLTTVAAGSTDREGLGSLTLGNGAIYTGASITQGVGPAPLKLASSLVAAGADPAAAALCFPNTLDPAKTGGVVVFCDRGVNARTEKSDTVRLAGGIGMILGNTGPNSLNADLHSIPTVHVDFDTATLVKAYISANPTSATATIGQGQLTFGNQAPIVASFSSRGPAIAGSGDLLKPDIMGPGVDILAGVSPVVNGRNYDFLSGTSMSSPHIAGLGAWLAGVHPDWSPMMIKSSLMTGASRFDNMGMPLQGTPLDFGSGQVRPTESINPGLAYDSNIIDWIGYLCGTELGPDFCDARGIPVLSASNLNYPTVSIGALAGSRTITRTVTSTSSATETYNAVVEAPAGMSVSVSPRHFTIAAGGMKTFSMTITNASAALGEWTFGRVTWKSESRRGPSAVQFKVRSEIAVRPVAIAVPVGLGISSVSGSGSFPVQVGFTGTLGTSVDGPVAATVPVSVALHDPDGSQFSTTAPATGPHTSKVQLTVPAGSTLAEFRLYAEDYAAGTDMDLFVFKDGNLVGLSAGGTASEAVNLVAPAAGTYDVYVDLYALAAGETSLTPLMNGFLLDGTDAGTVMLTAPGSVTVGQSPSIGIAWNFGSAGRKIGQIQWSQDGTNIATTLVDVDATGTARTKGGLTLR